MMLKVKQVLEDARKFGMEIDSDVMNGLLIEEDLAAKVKQEGCVIILYLAGQEIREMMIPVDQFDRVMLEFKASRNIYEGDYMGITEITGFNGGKMYLSSHSIQLVKLCGPEVYYRMVSDDFVKELERR